MSSIKQQEKFFDWSHWAHEPQRTPPGDWTTWLFMGGRGCGKTRTGAEWVRSLVAQRISPIALVGETMTEAMAVMVHGESGLLSVFPEYQWPVIRGNALRWENGVK
ncbi:MAG: terminase family protein, partial [Alphaproteobacteria bacterium]|nr:terminase family protein [Alphaproteobacteria bacterium]